MTSPKAWNIIATKLRDANVGTSTPHTSFNFLRFAQNFAACSSVRVAARKDRLSGPIAKVALQVRVISQQELLFEKEKGAVILDIRPTGEFENGHISGSHNASLFQLITGRFCTNFGNSFPDYRSLHS